jgi:hypothetical protein
MAPNKAAKKRQSSVAVAAPSPKKSRFQANDEKSRTDQMFKGILSTLRSAEDLSEHCREMLVLMATPSLSKAKSDRHELQHLGVTMIEEALQARKRTLIEAVDIAQKELSELEGSKASLSQHVDAAKTTLAQRESAKEAAFTAHEDAKAATESAEKALAEAVNAHSEVETSHAALEKESSDIESAYQEHFQIPVGANEGPHHIFLKPFLEKLSLEESLHQALPSSCVKTKEQRGSFDELVISELGKAFVAKIDALKKSIVDEAAVISERKATLAAAEQAVEAQMLSEKAAAADLEAAKVVLQEAEVELSAASEKWIAFEPTVQESMEKYNLHDKTRQEFEDGALKSFETLRDNDLPPAVETEAATAGA